MIDFIEYVVEELKSKRLSKANAAALVRQFSVRSAAPAAASVLHPLLHRNTSDLNEQSYRSTFTGEEFFLTDHQVKAEGHTGQKVLPAVAYLEMARAAIEQAVPARPEPAVLELRNTVWAQPIVISESRQISIALLPNDHDQIDYEIYSQGAEREIVHCQGQVVWSSQPATARLDLEQLRGEMDKGQTEPADIYATCTRMGLIYGPALQGIAAINRGNGQLLARLRLPKAVEETSGDYVLHPSLMDGALQACVGLIDDDSETSGRTPLPFALETLRILSPCGPEMLAWARYTPGGQTGDKVVKVDIDLCHESGNVCVQIRGFSWRVLVSTAGAQRPALESHSLESSAEQTPAALKVDSGSFAEKTQDYLRRQLAGTLKVPFQKIDPQAAMEAYGIDSILAMRLTNQLEKTFGLLSKTLFFEYRTIRELAEYFIAHYSIQLTALFSPVVNDAGEAVPKAAIVMSSVPSRRSSSRRFGRRSHAGPGSAAQAEPVAIIGLSGRYPEAINIDAFWDNLREGRDCIVEVPKDRWDWRKYFSDDRTKSGHHYSKWGGFIAGVDEFDPLFFNISPVEAEMIDPQERLFLQHAWMAVEDAGYTGASLQSPYAQDLPGQVGVYVGVMYNEYQLFGAEAGARGKRLGIAGSMASIANRVSYALNLHGPSMTLDTMCSSSLSAIHVACQDLKQGRTSLAIAGGVNVTIHPNKYLVLSAGQFISGDGHCQSFGEGGDGYIPGEGVGVVILKRLSEAKRDGDHIYGIIRGSALNHGGKTNGYSVPNPQAQASAISRALAESHIDARHISYIEAHGTGTKLGDPIEIAALNKAFGQYTHDTEFCLIGSVKSNVGHCESAAGIAGLTKVLLQMQHGQIVPSLHSAALNPHIDFPSSPFVVNQSLRPWESPVIDGRQLLRIAGISSFGAGGANAHMIVEEYQAPTRKPMAFEKVVILLSARTPEQLQQKARDLLDFVRPRLNTIDLPAMAYTLQTGREAMEERLGFVVSSAEQLAEKLQAWVAGEEGIEDAYQGQVKRNKEALSVFGADADLQQAVDKWIVGGKIARLLDLWTKGLDLDWGKLHGEVKPPRMSLPTYPFARERYWIDMTAGGEAFAKEAATAVLHPLLHSNTSDLSEQRYSSTFTGEEFFLTDHQVKAEGHTGQKVLPGVAYLEMARAAIGQAAPMRPESMVLELRNSVWVQPIVVSESRQINIALLPKEHDQIDYEIYSQDGDGEVIHGQGCAIWSSQAAPAVLDLEQLREQMSQGQVEPGSIYAACARMGLAYGPALQAITAIHRGSNQLLAQLRLPGTVEDTWGKYVLHPSLMDGALQACVGLIDSESEGSGRPRLPFALESLRVVSPCTREMFAWVRYSPGSHATDSVVRLDIDLCTERGIVCVQMHGLSSRVISPEISTTAEPMNAAGSLLLTPVWQAGALAPDRIEYAEHHIILFELSTIDVRKLQSSFPGSQCLLLQEGKQKNIAQRYSEYALACFERIKAILESRPWGQVLVHVVVTDEQGLFAGISGLLRTAALENPRLIGQLILISPEMTTEELARRLQEEKSGGQGGLIRYEQGVRHILAFHEVAVDSEKPAVAFKDEGVYLITGGLGGLGILFTEEILWRAREAKVILTGRSALNAERQTRLDGLSALAGQVSYRHVDLDNPDQVRQLITAIKEEYGQLNGILHSAGMIADSFILKKTSAQFSEVLAPKVGGTWNLDQASQDVELDFFVLFSSISGALGNFGQADYATGNGFMDRFAAYRNEQVTAKQRHGRTRSINWPLWQSGGMGVDAATLEMMQKTAGMQPMQTATGMEAFHRSLALPYDQLLVVEGDRAKLRSALLGGAPVKAEPQAKQPAAVVEIGSGSLVEKIQEYLRKQFAGLLKLPSHKIDPDAALETYGIDSVLAMKLTNQLEQTFGSLSKTLFFEYQTIASLAGYLMKAHPAIVREKVSLSQIGPEDVAQITTENRPLVPERRSRNRFAGARANYQKDIAIIGVAGRYPQAENLQVFWKNLQNGRDCITEIPPERWDHKLYFDPDQNKPGKSYSKWGGFIDDVDKFDPLFFNIAPREAALLDPQERLFLETAWQTIENAGYTKESIAAGRVGVYVGVMWAQYELFGAQSILSRDTAIPNSSHASIANRVSYFFDLHGPSIALDTMCSSSLTAIHLACEDLRKGELDAAIAGGVNLTIHPYKYLSLSQGKFAASDGRCRSFGEGGDGYVPGEGVGAVLLKPLDSAIRDGDQIYAVIKSSTVNHGGKTNGYTVPNPNAQAELILDALRKANIDPKTLSYVETHGTGTSLGDPIEITGLLKAFEGSTEEKQFCPIGSVKSNIGHLESAAGIAAVTKALLQIKYKQLVPSLHAKPLNPNINFADSPFYVQTELAEWKRPATHPRRVGVSSFGAGGSNAHLILEEYDGIRATEKASEAISPQAFVLSAINHDSLCRYARNVVTFLDTEFDLSLADIAYTSQVRRTPMDARLAIITSDLKDLRRKLNQWVTRRNINSAGNPAEPEDVFYGSIKEAGAGTRSLIEGEAGKAFLENVLAKRDLEKIAGLWILGVKIDWILMYRGSSRKLVSLPTYPFARERCWIDRETPAPRRQEALVSRLVQKNTPDAGKLAARAPASAEVSIPATLFAKTETYLKMLIGEEINLSPERIASSERLESFGIDSVMINRINLNLERDLGVLPKTLFYEHQTVGELATFLERYAREPLSAFLDSGDSFAEPAISSTRNGIAHTSASASEEGVDSAALLARTEEYLKELIGEEIRLAPERIGSSDRLESFGIDSVMISRINTILETDFGELPKTLFYEHQTVGELATFLVRYAREGLIARFGFAVLSGEPAIASRARAAENAWTPRISVKFPIAEPAEDGGSQTLLAKTEEYLNTLIGEKIGLAPERIGSSDRLESFGIDSVMISRINTILETDFGELPKTLFYEHQTVRELATFLLQYAHEALVALLGSAISASEPVVASTTKEATRDRAASIAPVSAKAHTNLSGPVEGADSSTLLAKTEAYLKMLIGEEIGLAPERIDSSDCLGPFEIDSADRIHAALEKDFGILPKTLLSECLTVQDLTAFLVREDGARKALIALFASSVSSGRPATPATPIRKEIIHERAPKTPENDKPESIAIIGIHVAFPHSVNMDQYWENLKHGRDLIDLVPPNRWDYEAFYDPDPAAAWDGKIYCKWGGFLDNHDKFDARFFNISPEEAKLIDPQERMFVESVWAALEDAGYTRDSLKERYPKARSVDVGVFAGVTTNSYHLWAPAEHTRGNFVCPSSMPWAVANRVSYLFDFNGPSMAVDTACSSSLVAIHLACESLRNRECQIAIAGGVNLYLHPLKYLSLCQKRMLSPDGKCRSYGSGDDGFVPGEGVGALVLKPLSKAVEDRDRIYAVIPASAFEHSGRSNGYSAPNPQSQASVISRTLSKAHVHPEAISYVEGHGTGTHLGDSIEIAALNQAFQKQTLKKHFCPIGSVKANVGHSEAAAGVAGLAKVILQLRHGQLAPSIHSDEINPDIEFNESPFYLQHMLSEWKSSPGRPRRALVNSFGAGGVNACMILEEYKEPVISHQPRKVGPYLFTLSARNEDRLREYADRLLIWLRSEPDTDLADLCYTLQTGREAMEERLAIVVMKLGDLIGQLDNWRRQGASAAIRRGSLSLRRGSKSSMKSAKLMAAEPDLTELASMWVAGEDAEWEKLYPGNKPRRISLPTYPFARERHWISDSPFPEKQAVPSAQLHPLISYNSSTLKEVSFSSTLSDTAFYATDHKVNEEKIFPGAGFLEMACISGNIVGEQRVRKITDIVWTRPLSFRNGSQTLRTLLKHAGDGVEYEVSSFDEENEAILHSAGKLVFRNSRGPADAEECIAIEDLKAQCAKPEAGSAFYDTFRKHGLDYGPAFQTIQEIYINPSFALSRLKIADHLKRDFAQFILHPAMMDGALQTVAGLVAGLESGTPWLPFALDEVDILHPVRQTCYALAEFADSNEPNHSSVRKFNIRLLNESGDVLIRFRNLFVRPLAHAPVISRAPLAAGLAVNGDD